MTGLTSLPARAEISTTAGPTEKPAAASRSGFLVSVRPSTSLNAETAATISRVLENELRRVLPEYALSSEASVATALEMENVRDCLGDETALGACRSEIARALGVDFVFEPHMGKLGGSWLMTLTVIDAKNSAVFASESIQISSLDEGNALSQIETLVQRVALRLIGAPVVRDVPQKPKNDDGINVLQVTAITAGSTFLVGGLGLHAYALFAHSLPYQNATLSREEMRRWEVVAPYWFFGPLLVEIGGAALLLASPLAATPDDQTH